MYQANEMSEMMMKANGVWMESAMRIGTVAVENQGQVARHQLAMTEKCVEAGTKQMSLLKDVRDGAEFVAKSSELATDFGQTMATMMREAMEMQANLSRSFMDAVSHEAALVEPKKAARKAAA